MHKGSSALMVSTRGCGVEVLAQVEGGLKLDVASDFLANDSKFKAFQVDNEHIGWLLNEQGALCWHQFVIERASVLVVSV